MCRNLFLVEGLERAFRRGGRAMKLEPANIKCPNCGNNNYMRHLIGKNVGRLDMKCINCNSYFSFDDLYKQRISEAIKPKMTNSERFRAMSDEELATWLNNRLASTSSFYENTQSKEKWLEWLRQEVDDGT